MWIRCADLWLMLTMGGVEFKHRDLGSDRGYRVTKRL